MKEENNTMDKFKEWLTIEMDYYVRLQTNNKNPLWINFRDNIIEKTNEAIRLAEESMAERIREKARKMRNYTIFYVEDFVEELLQTPKPEGK